MQIFLTIVNTILLLSIGYYLNKKLEEVKAQNQSRLAILPERLKRYQEASTLLIKMFNNIRKNELGKAIINCQDWFIENHVYLDEDAQKAFKEAYFAADTHATLLHTNAPNNEIQENWWKILNALTLFQQSLSRLLSQGEQKSQG